jgi:hypothetical protein
MLASRQNGRISKGPRTSAGKARSSRNSTRHGLTLISRTHPSYVLEIDRLAKAICGNNHDPLLYEHAIAIAECELIMSCVRTQAAVVIDRVWAPFNFSTSNEIKKRGTERRAILTNRDRHVEKLLDYYTTIDKLKLKSEETSEMVDGRLNACWQPREREEDEMVHEAISDLIRLSRYARRAWSQRRQALRNFIAYRNGFLRASSA